MTRTLADMTPAERADCVGRWATLHGSTSPRPVIIWAVDGDMVWRLSFPPRHAIVGTGLDQITPRFDLPRAWTPDGTPVEMTQEHGAGWIEKDREPMHWPIPVDEQDKTIQALSRLLAGAEEAATERAVQIGRVRNALSSIARVRADSEAALDHGYDNPEWHEATADALEYVIDLLTEALEGDTP